MNRRPTGRPGERLLPGLGICYTCFEGCHGAMNLLTFICVDLQPVSVTHYHIETMQSKLVCWLPSSHLIEGVCDCGKLQGECSEDLQLLGLSSNMLYQLFSIHILDRLDAGCHQRTIDQLLRNLTDLSTRLVEPSVPLACVLTLQHWPLMPQQKL